MIRLKHIRLLREWSQREVAELTDIDKAHICYIERGRMIPTAEQLKRLGKVFKCPPNRLLDHVAPTGLPDGADHRDRQHEEKRAGVDHAKRSFVDRAAEGAGCNQA
jgi:transcriptional regulator with XRE-family HTH domain